MESTTVSFSAKDVMKLREKTGLGMMDCKEALTVNGGDPAKAEEWLKAKLKGKMDTRTERTTAEGRVGVVVKSGEAAIVEVQTETDFTAKNPEFAAMVQAVLGAALKQPAGEVQADGTITKSVDEVRIKTGENMRFVRGEHLKGGSFGSYVHHDGKRGAVVQVEGGAVEAETLSGICMHIVAHVPAPVAVSVEDMPAAELEKVREAGVMEAKESGKPEDIAKKIAEGKVRKWLEENTLLNQMYVKDPSGKKAVKDVLPKGVKVVRFVRYTLGG